METKKNVSKTNKFRLLPFGKLAKEVEGMPKKETIWAGIKEGAFGIVYGPSKSGKTTFCENMAFSLAIGRGKFWGRTLYDGKPHKVLFISFEENCLPRVERISKQIKELSKAEIKLLQENYYQPDCNFQQNISNDNEWSLLRKTIERTGAKIVFVDSMTRLYSGAIEDSNVSQKLTLKLRELSRDLDITIISIHHTVKSGDKSLTQDAMAGSRVIAQESDFAIGINKTSSGKRYMKEVFYRYEKHSDTDVQEFVINDNQWLECEGWKKEFQMFEREDGRTNNENLNYLYDYIKNDVKDGVVTTNDLAKLFVSTGKMSNPTLHAQLKKLMDEGIMAKKSKGVYEVLSNSGKEVQDEN